ncbi:MAG TPA: SHOCT domain-containing protein [Acidimicrobiales bacterium]|jgi:hypothetical protein
MFAEFQVGQVLWSMLWFTILFLWIWLVIRIFFDIFRSRDMGGVAKFLWIMFVIFLPYLGVFVYLIARGGSMADRDLAQAQANDTAMRAYVQDAAGTGPSAATELAQLDQLRSAGTIDEAEFQKMKARIIG